MCKGKWNMKYRELIQFEALETIIQLRDADKAASREKFVSSYVISDEMADRIISIIIPQLQYNDPRDNKALLVVGNYGTGKSHLMAVVSAIAEDATLVNSIDHAKVKENAAQIAGLFKVIRTEVGATTRTLRDIIITELNEYLEDNGIDYQFPGADKLNNHKDAFGQMMAAFGEKYPNKGLLFVVDELLDYLRHRDTQQLVYDLSFLREVGEVCKDLRFRFMAGVQEAIFDSTRFSFMGNDVRRIRERFETVSILKEDIKYVVEQRLLKKTADQITKIREHIFKFTKYYGNLNEKIENFVRLFPIHPDYIDTFETLKILEKREILKSLSREMKKILEEDVPSDKPGLIAFDSCWSTLCDDPSFRTLPDVISVMDCSKVLEDRVSLSLPHKQFKPMALRIIYGLSLHRLTTGDIYSPIGATAEELRDRLCLYDPVITQMGSNEPDKELLTLIETVFNEIYTTVSGQFISKSRENNQYYLDLKKSDDYDAKIEQRAATLSPGDIDNYYYRVLMEIMECPAPDYRPGFRIWPHDIIWYPHKASRSGYLFFGTPNERSSTVPVRDFYIYFLEPYHAFNFIDEKKNDEVFFSLVEKSEDFENTLKLYGGAVMQADTSSGEARRVYQSRADGYLKQLVKWLREHIDSAFTVTYQGQSQNLSDFLKKRNIRNITGIRDNDTINHKDLINAIAEQCLELYFKELTSEYPIFTIRITNENRKQAAQDALRGIASGNPSNQALAILGALELLDDGKISTTNSRYAQFILGLKESKGSGQVINRDEIINGKDGVEFLTKTKYRLEPELVIVVIAALVYSGEVVLSVPGGQKFDAGKLSELVRADFQTLLDFKHLEQSKEYNLPVLQALFSLFSLPTGRAVLITQGKNDSVADLQNEIQKIVTRIVTLQNDIRQGIRFWDFDLISILSFNSEIASLNEAKTFFESLQSFNSPGKMKNLAISTGEIDNYKTIPDILNILDTLLAFAQRNSPHIAWIKQAVSTLQPSSPWANKAESVQKEVKEALLAISLVTGDTIKSFATDTIQKIGNLKSEYIKDYAAWHSAVRLNTNDEKKKTKLLRDVRFITLEYLTQINILPVRQVQEFKKTLNDFVACTNLTIDELQNTPVCPHCNYIPQRDGIIGGVSARIEEAEDVLEKMVTDWTAALISNLNDPWVKKNMDLLKSSDRGLLDNFIKSGKLPSPINDDFIIALKEALSKLDKVSITVDDIRKVLQRSGGPSTPGELKDRFNNYIDSLAQGKEAAKVRIVVE
jgi:hypothetical protein